MIAKGNQSELREAIAPLFSQPPQLFPEGELRTVDKAYGRLKIRHLRVSSELGEYLALRWPQVAQAGARGILSGRRNRHFFCALRLDCALAA